MTDPIADLFTRVRNGLMVQHGAVEMPNSKMKTRIAEVLKEEGFIKNFRVREDGRQGVLKLYLKYHNGDAAIRGIKRISKPGRRTYVSSRNIPKVLEWAWDCNYNHLLWCYDRPALSRKRYWG